jgi:acetoin utilization deacetylase AcuC-like enzyme
MKVFYCDEYHSREHAFDTTRKSKDVADYLRAMHKKEIELVAPLPLTIEQIMSCHDFDYINALRTGQPQHLAESSGFRWCGNTFDSVRYSNGGLLCACLEALHTRGISGSLSSGLHHASAKMGGGFCTLNGIAIAAKTVSSIYGYRVLVVDYDAHFGDGTESIIRNHPDIDQIDVSTNQFYGSRQDCRYGLRYLTECVCNLVDAEVGNYDLVIYNAGMDPHEDCTIGGLPGVDGNILAERDRFVFEHCLTNGVPVAFCLAGGYKSARLTPSRLALLHATTCLLAYDAIVAENSRELLIDADADLS